MFESPAVSWQIPRAGNIIFASLSSRTLHVTEGRIRIAEAKADGIMEAATGRIVIMDHAKKEYYETSFEEIAAWQKSRLERSAPKSGLARRIHLRSLSDMPKTNVKMGKGNRTIAGGLRLMGGTASAAMTGVAAPPSGIPTRDKTETLAEASEVKTEPLPGSVFEIPADYVKKDSPFKAARP